MMLLCGTKAVQPFDLDVLFGQISALVGDARARQLPKSSIFLDKSLRFPKSESLYLESCLIYGGYFHKMALINRVP